MSRCCRWNTIAVKRPTLTSSSGFINQKGHSTLNCQAVADYSCHFFDVIINWPGNMHDAQIFASLPLNGAMRNGLIPECKKVIVSSEDPVPICML